MKFNLLPAIFFAAGAIMYGFNIADRLRWTVGMFSVDARMDVACILLLGILAHFAFTPKAAG